MHRTVRIADFLHRRKDPVHVLPDREYSLVTVRLHHKGVVLREKKRGSLIGSNMYRISSGQFILSGIDARNGAFGIVPDDLDGAIVTNDFWYFDVDETVVKRDFFYWFTTTPFFLDACIKSSKGETQRIRLQKDLFFNFEFCIPPINEQEAFLKKVARVDGDLSALGSELNKQSGSLLKLRQTILQEAVEGKLTADWRKKNPDLIAGDNHASELLETIKAEKERLIDEGKIRKEKPIADISENEELFTLPEGWAWCRVGNLGTIERGVSPEYGSISEYKILNQKCVRWGHVITDWAKPVLSDWWKRLNKSCLTATDDILVNSTGEGTIGRSGLITSESEGLPFDTHVLRIRLMGKIASKFIVFFINSRYGQDQVIELKGAKTTKQTELGVVNLCSFVFPLPPIGEQRAIVERVENIMAMIDGIEEQVSERKGQSESLMRSVLSEAFTVGV